MSIPLRLGVNIDHVATLRNARGGVHPCPVRASIEAQKGGAQLNALLVDARESLRKADAILANLQSASANANAARRTVV